MKFIASDIFDDYVDQMRLHNLIAVMLERKLLHQKNNMLKYTNSL